MVIEDCRIVKLPRITDSRGNLTVIDGGRHVPFNIGRVYYVYDVPGGVERGGHAHRNLQQLIIPISGNFDVVLDNGACKRRFHTNYLRASTSKGLTCCPIQTPRGDI